MLACVPRNNMFCTREYLPVCGNGTTYSNMCRAEAAGFYNNCAQFVTQGACDSPDTVDRVTCESHQTFSEKGFCVNKPWSDFENCEIEKNQGACPGGNDPNPWVGEHCAKTCGVFVRTFRTNDSM